MPVNPATLTETKPLPIKEKPDLATQKIRQMAFLEERSEYTAWLDGLDLVVLSKNEQAGFQVSRQMGDRIVIVDQAAFTLRPEICQELWQRVFAIPRP